MIPSFPLAHLHDRSAVEERLKAIAAQLIAAHRRKDHALVLPYARQAGLVLEGQAAHHVFMKTIQVYHPDRIQLFWSQIEQAAAFGDTGTLQRLAGQLTYHAEAPSARRVVVDPEDNEDEEYGFDEGEFGFGDDSDPYEDEREEDWDPDAGTFYSAVKSELYGNLEVYPDPADLAKLEGELDLSDYDLHDLEGIEHCQSLTVLNLSRNNIDNLYPLKGLLKLEALDLAENDLEDADWLGALVNLKELDLSANDIDDVAFLDRLPRLKYVDLSGNPVRNKAVLARLEARGVIVIF